jgi:hypothetical protein
MLLGYGFGIRQRALRDVREIRGNEYVFKYDGDGIRGSHKCLLLDLSDGCPSLVGSLTVTHASESRNGWL